MRRMSKAALLICAIALLIAMPASVGAQTSVQGTGPNNAITDVLGVKVGHYTRTDEPYLTGTTVVLTEDGAVGGVDVRGGGPGTRETDLLDPGNLVQRAHAVMLSGGSAYGLDAAGGVMRYLEDREIGYPVGFSPSEVVPIVPGAIIFDLGRGGDFKARPTPDFGYEAAAAAADGPAAQGVVGAGTGATSGGLKAGVGTASADLGGGVMVGAIVVVNAAGSTVNPQTCEFYAAYLELDGEFGGYQRPDASECPGAQQGAASSMTEAEQTLNTTIGVVATNVALTKAQANKMASVAHDGMARAIRPVHTLFDGDTVFALSTGRLELLSICQTEAIFPADAVCTIELNAIYSAATDAFSRAVVHAMLNAESIRNFTSYCDRYPSACPEASQASAPPAGEQADGHVPAPAAPAAPDAAEPALGESDLSGAMTGGGGLLFILGMATMAAGWRLREALRPGR